MNREIKFRAWDGKTMLGPADVFSFGSNYSYLKNELEVMQYTGLKDKNGKEIYEGDVVEHVVDPNGHPIPKESGNTTYVIVWAGSGLTIAGVKSQQPVSFLLDKGWGECMELIGNIYENPNLLEDGR